MTLSLRNISRTLIALLIVISTSFTHADTLVVVVSDESTIQPLSRLELRKIFLGIPLNINGNRLKPLRNESSQKLIAQFYHSIVGMTGPSYNRKLMRNRLNYAADPPTSFSQKADLFSALSKNKNAVSYVWQSELNNSNTTLKVLQVIWHQN